MKISKKYLAVLLGVMMISSYGEVNRSHAVKADTYGDRADFERVYGIDRIGTSVEASGYQNSDTLVIAPAYSYEDQISAMNLVNKFNAKFVIADGTNVGIGDDSSIKKVYIVSGDVGSNTFIPAQVLRDYSDRDKMEVIGGDNAYERNLKTLEIAGYKNVGVASSKTYADALSSYSLLKEKNMGIMLVDGNTNYDTHGYNIKYTFGGKNSVKKDGGERIAGKDRYETSISIAKKTAAKNIAFVSGRNYADAMLAVNIANADNADILLTPQILNNQTVELSKKANKIYAVGGTSSLPGKDVSIAIEGVNNAFYGDEARRELEESKKPKKPVEKKKPAKPATKPKQTYSYKSALHKSGKIKINIPNSYMNDIGYENGYNKYFKSYSTSFYYKKLRKKYSGWNSGWKTETFAEVLVTDENDVDGLPGVKVMGRISKGGETKYVVITYPTDFIGFPERDMYKANKILEKNMKELVHIINDNIVGTNGWKYTRTGSWMR